MLRLSIAAVLAAGATSCIPEPPVPAPKPQLADVCLAPLANGASDPQPRDVHMMVDADKKRLHVTMCVVSNSKKPYAQFTAEISVFTVGGEFTVLGGGGEGYTSPVTDNVPPAPSMRVIVPADITIDPKYVDMGLSPRLMIRLYSWPCAGGTDTGTTCTPDTPKIETFMRTITP